MPNRLTLLFALIVHFGFEGYTQSLDLPRLSPQAGVSYTLGFCEVDIQYAAPAVRGREIFGTVVPWGEVWRAGADMATVVEFSQDVKVEGRSLRAGKYALFLIPREEGPWTAIFNYQWRQWGAFEYDRAWDALRVPVEVRPANIPEERLTYEIRDQGLDKGYIRLAWDKTRVFIRLNVDVLYQAREQIADALAGAEPYQKWLLYGQAAAFMLEMGQLQEALGYARNSTALRAHTWNWWTQAQIEAGLGDYQAAYQSAQKAKAFGMDQEHDNYYLTRKLEIDAALEEWKDRP